MTIEILRSVSNCLATGTKTRSVMLACYSLLLRYVWEPTKEFAAQRLFLEVGENWGKQGGWTKQDRQCRSLVNFKCTNQAVGGCQNAEGIIAGNVFVPGCLVLIKYLVVPCTLC
jgi:predicted hydrocarbon binding protein